MTVAAPFWGRISAEVDVWSADASGALFANDGRFGGHALHLRARKLVYIHHWCGTIEHTVVSFANVPLGRSKLTAAFEQDVDDLPTRGTLTLLVDDRAIGSGRITIDPGHFARIGERLDVGQDRAAPITAGHDGEAPWAFAGGLIRRVVVDVAGERLVSAEASALRRAR